MATGTMDFFGKETASRKKIENINYYLKYLDLSDLEMVNDMVIHICKNHSGKYKQYISDQQDKEFNEIFDRMLKSAKGDK